LVSSLDIHAVFYDFFPQSKMKRQPGICDYFKKQNKWLLVNNNKDYKKTQ